MLWVIVLGFDDGEGMLVIQVDGGFRVGFKLYEVNGCYSWLYYKGMV
jgi:hypothetical protein